MAPELF
jgi:serine/threonine-protein kinase ULK4